MAHEIVWSLIARDDLRALVQTIAADNPEGAERFACQLILQTDKLEEFPQIGRQVPERNDSALREIIVSPYRVIYRVRPAVRQVEIIRIWHGARGKPEID